MSLREKERWYPTAQWSCVDWWVGQSRCAPTSPETVEDCRWGLRSREMRSCDGIDHQWKASPPSNWCSGRDSCNDPCSIWLDPPEQKQDLRCERDGEWNLKIRKIMLDICKSLLYIGMHFRVCAEEGSENLRAGGDLHICDHSWCECEVLLFEGRVSDVRWDVMFRSCQSMSRRYKR